MLKYTVNEEFFDNIDTEAKAYVLGWFYAGGRISPEGRIRLQVKSVDEQILYDIKRAMAYTGPLYKEKNSTVLSINRKRLSEKLLERGCVLHRSLFTLFPHSLFSSPIAPHLLRGVFDCKGSIYIHKGKYLNLSITACESFLQPLREYLHTQLGIESKHYFRYSHTNTMQMMITKTEHSKALLDYCYRRGNVRLSRKYEKYQDYLKLEYNSM